MRNFLRSPAPTRLPPRTAAFPPVGRFLPSFLLPLLLLFAVAFGSPAFGQCPPDVNADRAVDADDALILYYAYSLGTVLGVGRGGGGEGGAGGNQEVSIVAASSTVVEGSPAVFLLSMCAAPPTALTVNVAVSATGDFEAATGTRPVVFETGEPMATLRVDTVNDEVAEAGTVTATVQGGDGYRVGALARAEVRILDDDGGVSALATGAGFRECADCPEMVVVPSGTFTMGESDTVYGSPADERPRHEVTIDYRFAAGRYEVTLSEWDACVRAGGCVHNPEDVEWGRGNRPVISVSWIGAKEYVAWLSRRTGGTYRLLTESEWEYAARAATTTIYYWGDEVGVGHASCWGCGGEWDGSTVGGPAPVGSFAANAFGLHDLLGNIWEWVEDCWHDDYTGAPDDGRAWEGEDGANCDRVLRGGAWNNRPVSIRSANRRPYYPGDQIIIFGFRVARTLD